MFLAFYFWVNEGRDVDRVGNGKYCGFFEFWVSFVWGVFILFVIYIYYYNILK